MIEGIVLLVVSCAGVLLAAVIGTMIGWGIISTFDHDFRDALMHMLRKVRR